MDFQEFKKQFQPNLFDEYVVTLHLNDLAGGTPKDPKTIEGWVGATCKEKSKEDRAKIVEATLEALPEVAEEKIDKCWVIFKQDKEGFVYLEGRCVKAALKECANVIRPLVKMKKEDEKGIARLKAKVAERVFVVENQVYPTRNGQKLKADACVQVDRTIHVDTPQGERSALKRSDVLTDVDMTFTVRRLRDNIVPEAALFASLIYMQHLGLGSDRSQGYGTSTVTDVRKAA